MTGPDFALSIATSLLATIPFELCRQGYLHRRSKKRLSEPRVEKLIPAPQRLIQGSYSKATKVRPGCDIDFLALTHPNSDHCSGLF